MTTERSWWRLLAFSHRSVDFSFIPEWPDEGKSEAQQPKESVNLSGLAPQKRASFSFVMIFRHPDKRCHIHLNNSIRNIVAVKVVQWSRTLSRWSKQTRSCSGTCEFWCSATTSSTRWACCSATQLLWFSTCSFTRLPCYRLPTICGTGTALEHHSLPARWIGQDLRAILKDLAIFYNMISMTSIYSGVYSMLYTDMICMYMYYTHVYGRCSFSVVTIDDILLIYYVIYCTCILDDRYTTDLL